MGKSADKGKPKNLNIVLALDNYVTAIPHKDEIIRCLESEPSRLGRTISWHLVCQNIFLANAVSKSTLRFKSHLTNFMTRDSDTPAATPHMDINDLFGYAASNQREEKIDALIIIAGAIYSSDLWMTGELAKKMKAKDIKVFLYGCARDAFGRTGEADSFNAQFNLYAIKSDGVYKSFTKSGLSELADHLVTTGGLLSSGGEGILDLKERLKTQKGKDFLDFCVATRAPHLGLIEAERRTPIIAFGPRPPA